MRKIEKIISYERKNSPVSYSSSPGNWEDGQIGAVDFASQNCFDKKCTMTLQKFAERPLKNFMSTCLQPIILQ